MLASGRDIEPVAPPERGETCRSDFLQFCKTYFAEIFYLAFGEFHIKTAKRMQSTIPTDRDSPWPCRVDRESRRCAMRPAG